MKQRVTVAVITLVALVVFGVLIHKQSQVYEMEPYLIARTALSIRLDKLVNNQEVLRMASRRMDLSAGNEMLAKCLFPGGVCEVTKPENQIDFAIPKSIYLDSGLISGTTFRPALYSTTGGFDCKAGTDGCPGWEVVTSFWAECPGKQPTCAQAERIHVRYQINPSSKFDWPVMPGSVPPNQEYKTHPARFARQLTLSRK